MIVIHFVVEQKLVTSKLVFLFEVSPNDEYRQSLIREMI